MKAKAHHEGEANGIKHRCHRCTQME